MEIGRNGREKADEKIIHLGDRQSRVKNTAAIKMHKGCEGSNYIAHTFRAACVWLLKGNWDRVEHGKDPLRNTHFNTQKSLAKARKHIMITAERIHIH